MLRRALLVCAMLSAACSTAAPGAGGQPVATTPSASPTAAAPAATPAQPPSARHADPDAWPPHLVAGPGQGPALFLESAAGAPAVGYITAGTPLEIAGAPVGNRIPVRIRGDLRVRGWFPMERLYAVVQQRGRVRGSHAYVTAGDRVRVLGPDDEAGRIRIAGEVNIPFVGIRAFQGTFPAAGLGGEAPGPNTDAPGQVQRLAAVGALAFTDAPGGTAIATLSARAEGHLARVVRQNGAHLAVLLGNGPYLAGYVQTTASAAPAADTRISEWAAPLSSAMPQRMGADADKPLARIAAGTRVRFQGTTIASVDSLGWARVMGRFDDGVVDVFVATDDRVAVRGEVPADAVQQN